MEVFLPNLWNPQICMNNILKENWIHSDWLIHTHTHANWISWMKAWQILLKNDFFRRASNQCINSRLQINRHFIWQRESIPCRSHKAKKNNQNESDTQKESIVVYVYSIRMVEAESLSGTDRYEYIKPNAHSSK